MFVCFLNFHGGRFGHRGVWVRGRVNGLGWLLCVAVEDLMRADSKEEGRRIRGLGQVVVNVVTRQNEIQGKVSE